MKPKRNQKNSKRIQGSVRNKVTSYHTPIPLCSIPFRAERVTVRCVYSIQPTPCIVTFNNKIHLDVSTCKVVLHHRRCPAGGGGYTTVRTEQIQNSFNTPGMVDVGGRGSGEGRPKTKSVVVFPLVFSFRNRTAQLFQRSDSKMKPSTPAAV